MVVLVPAAYARIADASFAALFVDVVTPSAVSIHHDRAAIIFGT